MIARICVFLVLIVSSCSSAESENHTNIVSDIQLKSIEAILKKQEILWNKGDIEGFMEYYWKSDSLKFIGKSGVSYGWENVLQNYKKSYPDQQAMGNLTFDIISTENISSENIFQIGKWTLNYQDTTSVGGHFSLLWEKKNGKWVIIADHSS